MSYLCIRVPEFPVQTLLSLRPQMRRQPIAVLEHEPPLERVCSMNARAFQQGVRHGMTRVEMENIADITGLRRSVNEEQSLRDALMALSGQLTPRLEEMSSDYVCSDYVCSIVLDLAGTERLIGSPVEVTRRLQQQLKVLNIEAAACVCDHVPTALAMVRTLRSDSVPALIPSGQERSSLAPLPVSAIEPDTEQAETFRLWGIRTLGQLAALPIDELVSRMGQSGKRLHELATGTHRHHFRPLEPTFSLQAQVAFEEPIELIDSLLFVLGPMLDRLIALATAKALALLSVQLTLKLDTAMVHTISVRPALPSTDRKFLLKLLQLELAAHPPGSAVIGLELTAEPAPPSRVQGGLFAPQLPDVSRLDVTLARIQSIVGEGNVGSAQLKDSHAPEQFDIVPFRVQPAKSLPDDLLSPVRMACRRLRPPWPARVTKEASRPSHVVCEHRHFRVKHAYGPWYSSGDWWNSDIWAREEWEVILRTESAPMPLHALLVHDLVAQAWRLEGVYD
ncbi:MAG TPA: hypothetical protein VK638_17630 [Edaphobacter sp.]|nr:hypothetical protein [Edaphobacter sp.]